MPSIIEIRNACKWYARGNAQTIALQDISLSIGTGDIYGIIGLSGAGKSTLIRAIAHLVDLSSGNIFFHGHDIALMEKNDLRNFRKNIGMIFQHFNLLSSRTVADNIAYPMEIAGIPIEEQNRRIDELLELVGLSDKKLSYPSQLSGGEKQRVGIARALATSPEVLLSDEATSALDPKTTKEILALLKKINATLGVTIILITHEMEVVKRICTNVAVIDKGCIVEKGNVVQIFADPQHSITKNFLQKTAHEIPQELLIESSPNRKLLRLTFKGSVANEPIMSHIVRLFDVDSNILLGWIERLQNTIVGTLIVEFTGTPERMEHALNYLRTKSIHYEVIENEF